MPGSWEKLLLILKFLLEVFLRSCFTKNVKKKLFYRKLCWTLCLNCLKPDRFLSEIKRHLLRWWILKLENAFSNRDFVQIFIGCIYRIYFCYRFEILWFLKKIMELLCSNSFSVHKTHFWSISLIGGVIFRMLYTRGSQPGGLVPLGGRERLAGGTPVCLD